MTTPWTIGDITFADLGTFRKHLKQFLKDEQAATLLADDSGMQAGLIDAFFNHYQRDPASAPPPDRSQVAGVVVGTHPKWGSACFELTLQVGDDRFRFSTNKLKSTRRPVQSLHVRQTAGQARRNLFEAMRGAVQSTIGEWEDLNPPPATCPITDEPLAPLTNRTDPQLRYAPDTPTVDHFAPTLSKRVHQFLDQEGLAVTGVLLHRSPTLDVWELADDGLATRWRTFHGHHGLRWISLAGNRILNEQAQQHR